MPALGAERISICIPQSSAPAAVAVTEKGFPPALRFASVKMYADCRARVSRLNRLFGLSAACHGPDKKRLGNPVSMTPWSVEGPFFAHASLMELLLRPMMVMFAFSAGEPVKGARNPVAQMMMST